MIDFGIPGDSLKLRQKIFKELMTPDSETGYMDGEDYGLMRPYIEDNNPSLESRLWMAFLYGTCYSCTTTLRFLTAFPTVADVTPKKLKAFWAEKKTSLWYQPDKRYLKNNDQVVPAIKSICQLSDKTLTQYLVPLLKQGFDVAYKEIVNKWKYFGPSGAYLFFDVVYAFIPELYSEPETLDWKHCGKTVPEGMAHLLGLDEQALHQEPFDIPRYNRKVEKLSEKGYNKNVIESNLCFLRKLFKGTRYLGYYADRQLTECRATAQILKEETGIDIWDYRKRTTPEELRGEIGGWEGIRKERYQVFLKTGTLMGEDQ